MGHETQDPVLRRLREELTRLYGDRVQRVLLYGSRARGDAREDSDYDIAVLLDGYDGAIAEVYRLADLASDLQMETGAVLSIKPFAPTELERRTLFMHNLRTEAIAV